MIDDALIGVLAVILLFAIGALLDALVESYRSRALEKRWQADMDKERRMRKHYEEAIGQPIAWEPITDPLDLRHLEVKHVPYKGDQ